MCFPDDLSVFTPGSVQSAKNRDTTLTLRKVYSEFLGLPLVVFEKALACFFSQVSLFEMSIGTSNLCLLSCLFLPSLTSLPCYSFLPLPSLLSPSPCCLPSSRQNQLKDQAQQALVSPGQLPEEAECLTVPKYKRDLVQKLKILRQELSQQQPQAGHCRIEVSREEIFEVRMESHMLSHIICVCTEACY